jgi:putative membrane protein
MRDSWIVRFFFNVIAVLFSAWLLAGISVDGFVGAAIVALVLGMVNIFIKPIMIILTFPITFVTLGLFLLVINALMILVTDYFVGSFFVDGFWWALLFSLVLTVVNSILNSIVGVNKNRRG